jgi:hypothetical protein
LRETWPDRPSLIAIDGKTSRRSHDSAEGKGPLHPVFSLRDDKPLRARQKGRRRQGQKAVEGKANELQAIPVLIDRLAEGGGLKGAVVAIATNAGIAQTIIRAGGDYLLAVKASQPNLRAETQSAFAAAPRHIRRLRQGPRPHRKANGRRHPRSRLARRRPTLSRRVPPARRSQDIRVQSRADRSRFETRYSIASAKLTATQAAQTNPVRAKATEPKPWPSSGASP